MQKRKKLLTTRAGSKGQYTLSTQPLDRNGCTTFECAGYVNGDLERNGIPSYGNSYDVAKGKKMIIDGYSDIEKPELTGNTVEDNRRILQFLRLAANNINIADTVNLDKDKLYTASMYYGTSPHALDFYQKSLQSGSPTSATHVGLVYFSPDHNQWRTRHNIHGTLHDGSLKANFGGDLPNYGITAISLANPTITQRLINILKGR